MDLLVKYIWVDFILRIHCRELDKGSLLMSFYLMTNNSGLILDITFQLSTFRCRQYAQTFFHLLPVVKVLYHWQCQSQRCSLFRISRAWCSLPLSLTLVSGASRWFQTPEWDVHTPTILWQNLEARADVAFVDNDGCSRQEDWHAGLNYITFKLFFWSFSRLMLQWDEAYVVGLVASRALGLTAMAVQLHYRQQKLVLSIIGSYYIQ